MKKQDILNLIKYHVENNDLAFRNEAAIIAKDFDKHGDYQLAEYIVGLISTNNLLTPQEITKAGTVDSNWLVKVPESNSALYLSETIVSDIRGIVSAVNRNIGINKFLFEGKPGTGKTESAKQLARLLDRQLYKIDFRAVIDSKLGQTNKNISEIFNDINGFQNPQSVLILLDEIDLIALDRIAHNDVREMGRATSSIFAELDNLNQNIALVATTNLYGKFDRALLRRFDATVNFDRYTKHDIEEIAIRILNENQRQIKGTAKDIKLFKKIINLADSNFTPGELKNIIKSALAFSDPSDPNDYLRRLVSVVVNIDTKNTSALKEKGFTLREIEILSGISKSRAHRLIKE